MSANAKQGVGRYPRDNYFLHTSSSTIPSGSPSPFHSSFGPTPTAATVTPAAASGTTAATTSSSATAAASSSATVATTTIAASMSPVTPFSVFGTTATTNSGFSLGSRPATTTVNTGNVLFTGPISTTATPHIFGMTTPLYTTPKSDQEANNTTPQSVAKSIRFSFKWPYDVIILSKYYASSYKSKLDGHQFKCSVKMLENCFMFQINCASEKEFSDMQWITTGIIQSPDRRLEISGVATHWAMNRTISISGPILSNRFVLVDGYYTAEITLSDDSAYSKVPFADNQLVNIQHCDNLLGKMLRDFSSYDVFFEFEIPAKSTDNEYELVEVKQETVDNAKDNSSTVLQTKTEVSDSRSLTEVEDDDSLTRSEVEEYSDYSSAYEEESEVPSTLTLEENAIAHPTAIQDSIVPTTTLTQIDETTKDKIPSPLIAMEETKASSPVKTELEEVKREEVKKDEGMDKGKEKEEGNIKNNNNVVCDRVGAHKIVLSQFPYFKAMFSSSFAEGTPGVKTIKIKDSDVQCFRLLIEFIYLGRFSMTTSPVTLTEDEAYDSLPTWEDVYLVADRYNMTELRKLAGAQILAGLSASWAIPFLFRTGYLFDDLRKSTVKFIVRNSMKEVVRKDALSKYYDHPECSAILTELLAEVWDFKTNPPKK